MISCQYQCAAQAQAGYNHRVMIRVSELSAHGAAALPAPAAVQCQWLASLARPAGGASLPGRRAAARQRPTKLRLEAQQDKSEALNQMAAPQRPGTRLALVPVGGFRVTGSLSDRREEPQPGWQHL